ncbi:MAG TPA: tetratricopeptide repeat protein [Spirochaetota bacterium]|nr:tetratricopeptide repeat protein [Spirochaetota bacterium]
MGEEKMKRYVFAILLALQVAAVLSCETKDPYDVSFSYAGIIDKEYRFNVGRVIPVTIGQSIETDGDISSDGMYFYYTSNVDSGNFDIYLRAMNNITTVRITAHPSKETNPVISPDGETLAFVSFRDDPEGDIYTVDIDAEKLIRNGKESAESNDTLDSKLVNLTAEQQGESGANLAIREANPAWSPDGKHIAYSRTMRGSTEIWIMKKNGKDKKQLTSDGGDYPSFSPDGMNIVYVSYSGSNDGEIYTLNIESGKTEKVQAEPGIKLYPCYAGSEGKFIYSLIAIDTNQNGRLDLDDRSVLQYSDVRGGNSYRLTKQSVSSFKAKWLSAVKTRDYQGIILYTDITGENINLNIIPDSGIIPKKQNAKLQLEYCSTYLEEWDDAERYEMSLEAVNFFFGSSKDNSARTYVDRSLGMSASYYIMAGRKQDAEKVIALLRKRASEKNPYASLQLRIAEDMLAGRKGSNEKMLDTLRSDKDKSFYIPFATEDVGDLYYSSGNREAASRVYSAIIKTYPDYERAMDIHVKISLCDDDLRSRQLSESAVNVLSSGNANQRITVVRNLIYGFQKGDFPAASAASYLKNVSVLKEKFKDDKKILPVIKYSAGLLYLKAGDSGNASRELKETLEITPKNDIISHLANIIMGDIERRAGRSGEAEKYYSEGFNSHSRRFRTGNLRERLSWLVDYYEQTGIRLSVSGRFMEGAHNHEKNILLLTKMHNKRLFPEIYTRYAARAHVLYVDSFIEWKGEQGIAELEKSYNDNMPLFRMDFNRAAIYGLAYIYTKKALYIENTPPADTDTRTEPLVIDALAKSDQQIEWALFLDDTFIEPYLLKSWNYQFIDYRRSTGDEVFSDSSDKFFPEHLWEKSVPILEKAVTANDESTNPENEGNLNLNMANTYFLLQNYPRALKHYQLAAKYKKSFGTETEQALYHFHYGYCHWQNNDTAKARDEISKAYAIYRGMTAGRTGMYASQYLVFYRYFALFSRYDGKYSEAIKWYRMILDLADGNKLEIDRARYLQEIARCYIEMGDTDTAISYINQAEQLLKKYPDDTRKYYAKIKLFGIGPFPVYDMGPDSLVIGGSSIFYPLDTFSKKLLNLSMLEEIALKNNDYAAAVKHLKNKIKLTAEKDTELANDIMIRSKNNLGYYYFLSGKYADAEKQFIETGKLSIEKENRDGMFSSILNLVNLYSMMIEENLDPGRDWLKVTGSAIKTIQGHRDTYRKLALNQEMEDLEKKAETAKRKVTAEEKEAAELRVSRETDEVNYKLDIAVSTLKFYRAEILYSKVRPQKTEKDAAYNLYAGNREIFNLYTEALAGFETALSVSGVSVNPGLQCRLLINSGTCYEKRGEYEKAYVALLDAKTIADKYELRWLKISANHALGSFMHRSGSEVEKGDARVLADRYISSALEIAEEHPLLVVTHAERIRSIYREYIQMLIASGNSSRAFTVSDRYAQFTRIALVNSISPEFKNSYDRRIYYDYIAAIGKLFRTGDEISALLESGAKPESEKLAELKKKWNEHSAQVRSMYDMAENYNPLISSCLEIGAVVVPDSAYEIYRFQDTPKGIFWWRISGKKLSSGYLDSADSAAVNRLFDGDNAKPVFILLNESFISLINSGIVIAKPYSAVNTLDRIGYYLEDTNPLTAELLSSIDFDGSAAGVKVTSWNDKINPADFSTVLSTGDLTDATGPSALFSSGILPACIVRAGTGYDYSSIVLETEAALYAGTTRVVFTGSDKNSVVTDIISSVYRPGTKLLPENTLVCGYIRTTIPETYNVEKTADREYRLYADSLGRLELAPARVHLAKWYSLKGETVNREYTVNLWHISMLAGDYQKSAEVINAMKPAGAEDQNAYDLMTICQLLYTGKISQARTAYDKIHGNPAASADSEFINIILSLAEKGDVSAVKRAAAIKKPYMTIIPSDRYLFLVLSYAILISDEAAKEAAALIPSAAAASERDMLLLMTFSGRKTASGTSIRFDRIATLSSGGTPGRTYGESAAGLFTGDTGYDRLSLFPVIFILNYYTAEGNPGRFFTDSDIARISAAADPVDALLLLSRVRKTYESNAEYTSALAMTVEMKKYSHAAPYTLAEIYADEARIHSLDGDYRAAYGSGLEAEKIYAERGETSKSLGLLMISILTSTGQYPEAAARAEVMKNVQAFTVREKYQFGIQLALIELNRLGGLKKATVDDAAEFERLFGSTLNMLTDNPSLAAGPGMESMAQLVFDEFINYKMRTGNYNDAHYYNEIKKIALTSVRSGINLLKKGDASSMGRLNVLIPESAVYVNISKNRKDLFIWIIDSKEKKAFIIPGGYTSAEKIITGYESRAAAGKDVSSFSKELQILLAPVYGSLKNKKSIIVCCDSWTEKIPLEIAGDSRMLCEQYSIVYVSSPLLLSGTASERAGSVRVISYSEGDHRQYIERAAVRESGVPFTVSEKADGGVAHVADAINYNRSKPFFTVENGRSLDELVSGSRMAYLTAGDIRGSSVTDLVLTAQDLCSGEIIVNNAAVRDVNSAEFIESFYSGMSAGSGSEAAFRQSADKLRSGRYRHPSNWQGLRIYVCSLAVSGN